MAAGSAVAASAAVGVALADSAAVASAAAVPGEVGKMRKMVEKSTGGTMTLRRLRLAFVALGLLPLLSGCGYNTMVSLREQIDATHSAIEAITL